MLALLLCYFVTVKSISNLKIVSLEECLCEQNIYMEDLIRKILGIYNILPRVIKQHKIPSSFESFCYLVGIAVITYIQKLSFT